MGRFSNFLAPVLACLWMIMAAGCIQQVLMVDEPAWHQKASGVYHTSAGKHFYGVGRASGIRSTTLLKATAGNAARKEMDRVLRGYVAALVDDAVLRAGGAAPTGEALAQLRGLLVRNAVQRAVISDHWTPGPERLLALCELDLETLKVIMDDDGLPLARLRQAMRSSADRVHGRLSGDLQSD